MAFEIPEHFHKSFTTNVELLLQKTMPTFAVGVPTRSYTGKSAQVVKQFGEIEFLEKASRHADTVFGELEHKQRWVFPKDYTRALPIDSEDELRMLNSPQSSYVEAMRAGWARKWDQVVRDAATGNNQTGENGSTSTALPAGQIIAAGGAGLTLAKLKTIRKTFRGNNVAENRRIFMAVSENQIDDLLGISEINNSDFNTDKPLVDGTVGRFMGINFVMNTDLVKTGSDRDCIAWVEGGIIVGQWNGLESRIGERPDKEYTNQVFMRGTIGATRTQEELVMKVTCQES